MAESLKWHDFILTTTMHKRISSYIPDAITCLNLVSGCIAIFMAFNIGTSFGAFTGGQWAMIAIAAAAVFDFFDGASARALNAYSDLGKDLDSLSDLVSFGVAPAMLVLNAMLAAGTPLAAGLFTLAIPVCGAIRLAKFNNDTTQGSVFKGLPIPANAIFWIGTYAWFGKYGFPGWVPVVPVILLVSQAMTANFRMFSLKFKNFDLAPNFLRYVILFAAILFLVCYGLAGLVWTILLYILLSYFGRNRF